MDACGERAVTELPQTARKGRGGRPAGEHPSLSQCESRAQHVCAGSRGRGSAWVPEGPLCCCPRDLPWPRTQGPRHCRTLPQSLGYEKRLKEGPLVVSVSGGRRRVFPRESLSRVRRSCHGPLVFVYPVVTCGCLSASVQGPQIVRFW